MHLGVILNRVFRINHNPLLDYVITHQDEIKQLYLILPIEDLSDAATVKREDYHHVVKGFVSTLIKHNIHPYIVDYKNLDTLANALSLSHVLMAKDIMSYHRASYDYPHMKKRFEKHHISVIGQRVNHYFQPSKTFNQQHQPYQIFTYFYKANRQHLAHTPQKSTQLKQLAQYATKGMNQSDLKFDKHTDEEACARQSWNHFLNREITLYSQLADDITRDNISGLSRYLAYGLLDIREVINHLLEGYDSDENSYESFIRELMFREFYYVLMTQYPDAATQSFSVKYRNMEWSERQSHFEAWKNGETGYPIIDAAMKKLLRTGYMHNRLRMIVSQFLTKHLFMNWTWGEAHFRRYLIDYDNASNVHGWQWSASTGTDAVPYFRMFNPIRQSERFDAMGDFIKEQLQILKDVKPKYIHNPSQYVTAIQQNHQIKIGEDYPKAIVNHKESRDYVMQQFKQYTNYKNGNHHENDINIDF
ncbi:cryptochrome/photolyase family protein [Staphylococcus pseudintermedius]|uniref:cryptochrome/photolyase family protein n=1 Tax=Staphylococcus pseudintermedius TaxID=283734 RepID=UPI002888F04B|nr:deoxyribodipyrimidine photo-lyase [Staphylococcus pseudintermedius]MDT0922761.1 deoxyribodipyrimidine photo-lyase [Staphylococcus pseudintermedius]